MPQESPFLGGWAQNLWGCFGGPWWKPAGIELPLWRLSYNFTKTDGGLDLAMEDKGTPHVVIGSSSPRRARTAT